MFRIVDENVERDNVHNNRAEQQQTDIAQPRNHHDQPADEFKQFHELGITRRAERRHEMRGGRAFRQLRHGNEVEQDRHTRRQEAKSEQAARDAREIFFHTQLAASLVGIHI